MLQAMAGLVVFVCVALVLQSSAALDSHIQYRPGRENNA